MKDEAVYLRHILERIRRIEEDVSRGRDEFMRSHTIQDAVLRNLQVLSESTQRLSEPLRARHPEIEWRRIAAFRNLLVHDYLGVDLGRVWEVVERDIPELKRAVMAMLEGLHGLH
ncbi:MAG TPA: DUF86 domain-containing protein [Terriglobia bacterium]|nr:DUF86 domain-containing protein [Terriglobia bacterium]